MITPSIYQSVKKQFKSQHWLGKKIIVTVSGGADSMALCVILQHLDIPFVMAHCNFQLRNEESDGDEAFVTAWAKANSVPVYIKKFDTKKLLQSGGNLQDLCRQLRYDWFEELRQKLGFDLIATAHHQQDVVETVLMNLLKGTGIAGLHGIAAQNGNIIRPLLAIEKDNLRQVLIDLKLVWREDSSNAKDDYMRNKIRHNIIPLLNEVHPSSVNNIYNTSRRIQDVEAYVYAKQSTDIKKLLEQRHNDIYIPIRKLWKIPGYKSLFYAICKQFNFSAGQVGDCLQLLSAQTGKSVANEVYKMIKNRDFIIITAQNTNKSTHILIEAIEESSDIVFGNKKLSIIRSEIDTLPILKENTCLINPDALVFPLKLRPTKEGDYLYPFGMQLKKKKVSKLLKDLKYPIHEKENVWVLQNGDEKIIWVVGIRFDERFKVINTNKDVLQIKYAPSID